MINIYELSKIDSATLLKIKTRARTDIDSVHEKVESIIADVRKNGDEALVRLTRQWDYPNFELKDLQVRDDDVQRSYDRVDKQVIEAIRNQISRSRKFHQFQKDQILDWKALLQEGIIAGEKWTAIANVGLYIPGGKNPFPTVQQILAVPAKLAGARRIVSCISPKGNIDEVIIAATECGVNEIYKVSGAQAIAAMAYGTETIKPVDFIAGPGSPFVTAAKIMCQQKIAIDMPAGPSEAIILADESVPDSMSIAEKARYCAADILARAEHGPDSAAVLVTDSRVLASLTAKQVEIQFELLSRKEYIVEALCTYSAILIVDDMKEALEFINDYAPEHLEILASEPEKLFEKIDNAGSVFLGYYNPVAAGDYATGVNHTLPASGWARQCSSVSVWTFMKRVQFSQLTKDGLNEIRPIVQVLSKVEGLDAHRRSVDIRFESAQEDNVSQR